MYKQPEPQLLSANNCGIQQSEIAETKKPAGKKKEVVLVQRRSAAQWGYMGVQCCGKVRSVVAIGNVGRLGGSTKEPSQASFER